MTVISPTHTLKYLPFKEDGILKPLIYLFGPREENGDEPEVLAAILYELILQLQQATQTTDLNASAHPNTRQV